MLREREDRRDSRRRSPAKLMGYWPRPASCRGISRPVAKTNDADHRDDHEAGDDRQMLEERIELAGALKPVERPELMRHHGRERRKYAECAGPEPCPQVQDHQQ